MKLDRAEIQAAIARVENEFLQKQGELDGMCKDKQEIQTAIERWEYMLSGLRRQWSVLQQRIIICDGIPREITELRERIMRIRKMVLRKDIRISTKEKLDKELVSLYLDIQGKCAHSFVMQIHAPYQGSQYNEYEDCHGGLCLCVVCDYQEESINNREDIYPTFSKENAPRIIAWCASAGWERGTDIWQPLDEILEEYFLTAPRGKPHILIIPTNNATKGNIKEEVR